jgi:hypothetical protein
MFQGCCCVLGLLRQTPESEQQSAVQGLQTVSGLHYRCNISAHRQQR